MVTLYELLVVNNWLLAFSKHFLRVMIEIYIYIYIYIYNMIEINIYYIHLFICYVMSFSMGFQCQECSNCKQRFAEFSREIVSRLHHMHQDRAPRDHMALSR